jgi:2-methylcitrate dehydratase PrpD
MIDDRLERAVRTVAALSLHRLPDEVLRHAGRTLADTIGVAYAGAREPEMDRLIVLLAQQGLVQETADKHRSATVLAEREWYADPGTAAFLNATAGGFLELDEGMRPTGHPGMQIVPAAVAVAQQRHATGEDLLRAFVAAYELTARLFETVRLKYPLHPHGHLGAVGAAVACAMLSDADPVAAARSAATTPLLPVWDACFDGATTRNTYLGIAARSGVMSVLLSQAGFTGSWSGISVGIGGIAGHIIDAERLDAPLDYDDLGISRNYFKRHSACALTHAAIDAVLQLDLPAPNRIEHILVETVANNMKLDRQALPNALSTRFSMPYAVAACAVTGRSDPETFRYRSDIAQLAKRVEMRVADDLQAKWPAASPARVTVTWADGNAQATVRNPHGHWTDPLTAQELQEKFESLVGDRLRATSWWNQLTTLPDVADCGRLFARSRAA